MTLSALINILLGVISGVLTYIFMWTIRELFTKILMPWYMENTYKGYDVSGEWTGTIDSGQKIYWEISLNLEQSAHSLTGTYVVIKYADGEVSTVSNLAVNGSIWEGYLSLQCKASSKKSLSFGNILLKVGNRSLVGAQLFRQLGSTGDIFHKEVSLYEKRPDDQKQMVIPLEKFTPAVKTKV